LGGISQRSFKLFCTFFIYTANKMVSRIVSKKQQENIILLAVVMG